MPGKRHWQEQRVSSFQHHCLSFRDVSGGLPLALVCLMQGVLHCALLCCAAAFFAFIATALEGTGLQGFKQKMEVSTTVQQHDAWVQSSVCCMRIATLKHVWSICGCRTLPSHVAHMWLRCVSNSCLSLSHPQLSVCSTPGPEVMHVTTMYFIVTVNPGVCLQVDFVPTYIAELAFWPLVQTLNFSQVCHRTEEGRRRRSVQGVQYRVDIFVAGHWSLS